jgi:hypothetical protein
MDFSNLSQLVVNCFSKVSKQLKDCVNYPEELKNNKDNQYESEENKLSINDFNIDVPSFNNVDVSCFPKLPDSVK